MVPTLTADPSVHSGGVERGLELGLETLGLALPQATQAKLMAYLDLLLKWNKVYNLTAIRDRDEAINLHLLDCLAFVAACRDSFSGLQEPSKEQSQKPAGVVIDLGSGAGLPAVVIAAVYPDLPVYALDSVDKKISFQRQAAAQLGLKNWLPCHARIEQWTLPAEHANARKIVTSRAYASLSDMVQTSRHFMSSGDQWLAMKGQRPDDELEKLRLSVADVECLELLATSSVALASPANYQRHVVRLALNNKG